MKRILLVTALLALVVFSFSIVYIYNAGEKAFDEALKAIDKDGEKIVNTASAAEKQSADVKTNASQKEIQQENNNDNTSIKPAPAIPSVEKSVPETKKANQSLASNLDKVEEEMPVTEKVSISAMVIKKLTPADMAELRGMLANGITTEEKERAKQILYSRLTSEDIKMIKEAYTKYSKQE